MRSTPAAFAFWLATAAAAFAASPTTPPSSGNVLPGGNAKDPISIEAGKLVFSQKEQKATYSGDVVAIQGPTTLKCSTMVILLEAPNAPATRPTPAATASSDANASNNNNQVKRMDCAGPATVLSKTQVATGDSAVYVRAENSFVMIGNVTYSDGGNVTKGDKLEYDLNTGRAVVESGGKTRVRSEFVPGQTNGK